MVAETLLARKFTDAIGAPFLDAFRYQYAISDRPLDLPEFGQMRLGRFTIHHSPHLPVSPLLARDGTLLGVALGWPVTPDGVLLDGETRLDLDPKDSSTPAILEAFVRDLSGRFVVVLGYRTGRSTVATLQVDCTAALSAVYDPETRICASSLLLALTRDIDPHPIYKIPAEIHAFPELATLLPDPPTEDDVQTATLGETFDARVRQVLANHRLDLADFSLHRLPLPDPEQMGPEEAGIRILSRLRSTMSALQAARPGYLSIGGDRTSRSLLAAAPDGLGEAIRPYASADGEHGDIDLRLAKIQADKLGLPCLLQPAAENDSGSYFDRPRRALYFRKRCAVSSGLTTTGSAWWRNGYFRSLTRDALWLRGDGLDLLLAKSWTHPVDAPLRQGLRLAMRRLGLMTGNAERNAVLRQDLIHWLDTLPEDWRPAFHDFWYQELDLSHSQSAFLGQNELLWFPPGNDPTVFHLARCVPPRQRRANLLSDAIIRAGQPKLAGLPDTDQIVEEIRTTGLDLATVLSFHV